MKKQTLEIQLFVVENPGQHFFKKYQGLFKIFYFAHINKRLLSAARNPYFRPWRSLMKKPDATWMDAVEMRIK